MCSFIASIYRFNDSNTIIYANNSSIVYVLLKIFVGQIFEYVNHILQFDYSSRSGGLSNNVCTNLNKLDYCSIKVFQSLFKVKLIVVHKGISQIGKLLILQNLLV